MPYLQYLHTASVYLPPTLHAFLPVPLQMVLNPPVWTDLHRYAYTNVYRFSNKFGPLIEFLRKFAEIFESKG
jgi:hypothetical protein